MANGNYKVYMHVNKTNNKKYIGMTKQSLNNRWCNGKGYKRQLFNDAIEKYGWENFEHIILFDGLSREEANIKEIEMISLYKSDDKMYGYNVTSGGENGHNKLWSNKEYHDAQCRERKSRWEDNKYKERRLAIINEFMKTDSYKQKQSKKTKERWENGKFDEIFCKPVMCLETGVVYKSSQEASDMTNINRTDIGKCCRNEAKTAKGTHWIFYNGIEYTDDDRKNLIKKICEKGNGIPIICVETGLKYNSIKEAAKDICIDNSAIGKVLKGRQKTAGGYHWIYCK